MWTQGYLYLEAPLLSQEKWTKVQKLRKCTLKAYLAFRKHFLKKKEWTFFEQSSKIRQRRKTQDEGINSLQTLFAMPLNAHWICSAYPDDF